MKSWFSPRHHHAEYTDCEMNFKISLLCITHLPLASASFFPDRNIVFYMIRVVEWNADTDRNIILSALYVFSCAVKTMIQFIYIIYTCFL
ncbi:hypothetical protein CDG60_15220 [Acinetobacter chinensis]|uniref:Uncharacterized protein n=1 Tax=Acinetobacter chinensis TaxID=2004650 RepID=A0A3B7M0D1_9GAMM|nr:hypothetical protein CDG60_15220 [Acinetobacter chinensis]